MNSGAYVVKPLIVTTQKNNRRSISLRVQGGDGRSTCHVPDDADAIQEGQQLVGKGIQEAVHHKDPTIAAARSQGPSTGQGQPAPSKPSAREAQSVMWKESRARRSAGNARLHSAPQSAAPRSCPQELQLGAGALLLQNSTAHIQLTPQSTHSTDWRQRSALTLPAAGRWWAPTRPRTVLCL